MKHAKLAALLLVWASSIILLGTSRQTYFVEKAMEVFNFEFPSKEAYALTVGMIWWFRRLYLGALVFLTFHLFRRQRISLK